MMAFLKKPISKAFIFLLAVMLVTGNIAPFQGFASEEDAAEQDNQTEITSSEDASLDSDLESEIITEENVDLSEGSVDESEEIKSESEISDTHEESDEGISASGLEMRAATITVTTFTEFSTAVTTSDVDTIMLGANIGMTTSVAIPTSKQSLIIDGQGLYTLEQIGRYTLTTTSNTSATYTLKNMTIIGRSFYGVVQCAQVGGAPTVVLENISYIGPQIIYNRAGNVEFTGTTDITITKNDTISNDAQEVAEAHGVSINGNFNLEFTSTGSSFFWMLARGSEKPFFIIEEDAEATFHTSNNMGTRGFFWIEGITYNLVFEVKDRASLFLDISGYNSFGTDNSHRLDSFTVGANANVKFNFAGGIVVSDTVTVEEDATMHLNYLSNPTTGTASYDYPLFRFQRSTDTTPLLNFNNPKAVVLAIQPQGKGFFDLANTNSVHFQTTDFNYWETYDAAASQQKPHSMWSSDAKGNLGVTFNLGTQRDNLISLDATDAELAANFTPTNAQVIQIGTDPFQLEPDTQWTTLSETSGITPYGAKVYADYTDTTGATHSYSGYSANNNHYSIPIDNTSIDNTTTITLTSVIDFVAVHSGVAVSDSTQLIQIRIPITMLFGTLEEYGTGTIISPQYEIENQSKYPVDVTLAEFNVIDDDGISLLSSENDSITNTSLNLSLNLDGTTVVDYLHPRIGNDVPPIHLTEIESSAKRKMTLSGTYYGVFSPNTIYQPTYSLVWSFAPVI